MHFSEILVMYGQMALEVIEKSVEKSRYTVKSDRVFWQSSKTLPEFMTDREKYQIVFCCQKASNYKYCLFVKVGKRQ